MTLTPLEPGQFTARVTLYHATVTQDPDYGDPRRWWERVSSFRTLAEPISHNKIRTADQQTVVEKWRFTTWPRRDVAMDMVAEMDGLWFTIRSVDRSRRDRLIFTAEADARNDRDSTQTVAG
ncbi:head-tail adaptor protein [Salmonella enterica]|nr:head-tail adaptor protein [Salmonella enterica]EBA9765547.1 head-tail adaptor protein [Salmonella enterica]EEB5699300.1 head-tail adaptor protein [Salmonella enterica]EGX5144516.1 head-tail adaptor protein [Salmonella enterica]ELF4900211.1 head-tail adaptor protein [Salmonella enterica]